MNYFEVKTRLDAVVYVWDGTKMYWYGKEGKNKSIFRNPEHLYANDGYIVEISESEARALITRLRIT